MTQKAKAAGFFDLCCMTLPLRGCKNSKVHWCTNERYQCFSLFPRIATIFFYKSTKNGVKLGMLLYLRSQVVPALDNDEHIVDAEAEE